MSVAKAACVFFHDSLHVSIPRLIFFHLIVEFEEVLLVIDDTTKLAGSLKKEGYRCHKIKITANSSVNLQRYFFFDDFFFKILK